MVMLAYLLYLTSALTLTEDIDVVVSIVIAISIIVTSLTPIIKFFLSKRHAAQDIADMLDKMLDELDLSTEYQPEDSVILNLNDYLGLLIDNPDDFIAQEDVDRFAKELAERLFALAFSIIYRSKNTKIVQFLKDLLGNKMVQSIFIDFLIGQLNRQLKKKTTTKFISRLMHLASQVRMLAMLIENSEKGEFKDE